MFNPSFANEIDSLFVEETISPATEKLDNSSAIIDQLLATTTTAKKIEPVLAEPKQVQSSLMSDKQRQYIQQLAEIKGQIVEYGCQDGAELERT